jgi:hypothetical protein
MIIRCNYGASVAMLAQVGVKTKETAILFRLPISLFLTITV